MPIRINVENNANIELSNADITVSEGSIEFSLTGEITDIPDGILTEYTGNQLSPIEIIFEEE